MDVRNVLLALLDDRVVQGDGLQLRLCLYLFLRCARGRRALLRRATPRLDIEGAARRGGWRGLPRRAARGPGRGVLGLVLETLELGPEVVGQLGERAVVRGALGGEAERVSEATARAPRQFAGPLADGEKLRSGVAAAPLLGEARDLVRRLLDLLQVALHVPLHGGQV